MIFDTRICIVCSGGVPITVTGENVDSVAEPIMVVTVITNTDLSIYYQVAYLIYVINQLDINVDFEHSQRIVQPF